MDVQGCGLGLSAYSLSGTLKDMKIVLQGLEDSGKSLRLAMIATTLVERNSKWRRQSGKERPIYSNMAFNPAFVEWARKKGVSLKAWKNIEEILFLDDVDIIMDEIVKYFDARRFADLSGDAKTWLSQSSKRGVEIYGATQDFSMVDIFFRRLVGGRGGLFHIRKIVGSRRPSSTKPPVKRIWGVCSISELDAIGYDAATSQFKPKGMIPRFFFIERKYCQVFDTKQKIVPGDLPPLRHTVRKCERPECTIMRVSHV